MKSPIEQVFEHCLYADVYDLYPNKDGNFKEGYITALEDLMNAKGFKKLLEESKCKPSSE